MRQRPDFLANDSQATSIRFPLVLILLGLACGREEPVLMVRTDDPSFHSSVGSFGLITLRQEERTAGNPCLRLSGQFVHYANIRPAEVIRALDPEIGRLPNEGILGQCREIRIAPKSSGGWPQPSDPGTASPFAIDLLDAGRLLLKSPGGQVEIEPRAFPDLLTSVGGMVYSAPLDGCVPLSGDGDLTIQAEGGPDVGPFSVQLPLPQQPVILAVAGIPPDQGRIELGYPMTGPVEIRWHAEAGGDVFHIEAESGEERLVCLVPDQGSFPLYVTSLSAAVRGNPVHIQVRRIRVQPFEAPGIRDGEMVTIVQDAVLLIQEQP